MALKYFPNQMRLLLNQALGHQSHVSNHYVHTSYRLHHANWTQALSNAERVVGLPTSFSSLQCSMNDDMSNMAFYLKKLIGTGHPLLTTARQLVYSNDKIHQPRGLLVLLISKAINKTTSEILPNQRSLAEITELIHTAHLIHSGVVNIEMKDNNLELGNKMAILCGDYLLAHSCVSLAALQNAQVVELISEAISDISTAAFIDVSMATDNSLEKWSTQAKLRYGTLLANACQSSLILGNNLDMLSQGHSFGIEIALAMQANMELQNYKTMCSKDRAKHSLCQFFPSGTSYSTIVEAVEQQRNKNINEAICVLKDFPNNEATNALYNIIKALRC